LGSIPGRSLLAVAPLSPGASFQDFATLVEITALLNFVVTVNGVPALFTPRAGTLAEVSGLPLLSLAQHGPRFGRGPQADFTWKPVSQMTWFVFQTRLANPIITEATTTNRGILNSVNCFQGRSKDQTDTFTCNELASGAARLLIALCQGQTDTLRRKASTTADLHVSLTMSAQFSF
jgi:hypothetical protein